MRKVGFGIIGAGMIAEFHAHSIKSLDNVELIGFFDTNLEAAKKRAAEFNCRAYQSLEELLSDSAIEAVTIATPSGLHGEIAIAAAKAKKHILCEKPLEITVEKVDEIIKSCEENNVLLVPVFQIRFTKQVQTVLQAIKLGRLGKMLLASAKMRWFRSDEYYSSSNWRGTWDMDGGGALMNQAIHMIDLLLYLNGDVESVFAYSGTLTHEIEVEDNLCAIVKYCNGSFGTIEVSTSCAPGFPRELELSGSEGTIAFGDDKITRWEFVEELEEDEAIKRDLAGEADAQGGKSPTNINMTGHACQIADLANAILNNTKPVMDMYEGRRAVELICGIYKSAQTGKPYIFERK